MLDAIPFDCRDVALFFDFDGTLADIAPTPETAQALPGTTEFLRALQDLGAAVAIVSGRSIASIDELLAPQRLPASGVHGCERRDVHGAMHRAQVPDLAEAAAQLQALCRCRPGLQCEVKRGGLTLHFRRAPQYAQSCREWVDRLASSIPGMLSVPAKMAVELRPEGLDKVSAVRAFLQEAPFRGRVPVYCGDDTADEPVFAWVQARNGLGIKVGAEPSAAALRVRDPVALREHLASWALACTRS